MSDKSFPEDLLFRYYMEWLSPLYDLPAPALTNDDISAVLSNDWPGNVRELKSLVERRVLAERRSGGSVRRAIARQTEDQTFLGTLREAVAAIEGEVIGRVIQDESGRMD